MNEISLCTGIGGFGLAARWMGWQSVATCEIDPFCQRVIKKNFPGAYHHSDLFTLTADILETEIKERFGPEWRKPGVILTAGLPCQPFSVAGKRDGQNDPRFFWPAAIGLVRELRPDVCLFENVGGLLSILEPDSVSEMERKTFELFDENDGKSRRIVERVERRIIGRIIEDIEQSGYVLPRSQDGTPIIFCVPACAVEAIHRRDRVWICAYAASGRGRGAVTVQRPGTLPETGESGQTEKSWIGGNDDGVCPDAGSRRRQNGRHGAQQEGNGQTGQHGNGNSRSIGQVEWQPNNTSEILRTAYGIPGGMDGRIKNRNARIKALGNAIVPQVSFHLFQAIEQFFHNQQHKK